MLIKFRHTAMATLKDNYWYDQSGHYYIKTKEDLKAFRDILNGNVTKVGGISKKDIKSYYFSEETVELCNDIDLEEEEWEPIGTKYSFCGTFNGNNHEIKNLKISRSDSKGINVGFFSKVGGTVKNLTVAGRIDYKCNISNGVANHTDSTYYQHEEGTGGIVGALTGNIQNCINKVNIVDERPLSAVGGIVGLVLYNKNGVSVKNCVNFGKIDGCTKEKAGYCPSSVGGIVGLSINQCTIQESINNGEITEHDSANSAFCGGIIGCVWTKGKSITVERCKNTGYVHYHDKGTVTFTRSGYGGIAGGIGKHDDTYTYLKIKNSYNTGQILSKYNSGGILGAVYEGYVNSTSLSLGGQSSATLSNCYNIGSIKGKITGGIVGKSAGNAYNNGSYSLKVSNCFSLGEISSDNSVYGSLIGFVSSYTTSLTYSYCSVDICDKIFDYSSDNLSMDTSNTGFVEDLESCVKDITKLASSNVFSTCTSGKNTYDAKWDTPWSSLYWCVDNLKNNGFPILRFEIV